MAKKQSAESVYRVVDVVGVSDKSWEEAGRRAVETAAGSLRDLQRRRSQGDGHESRRRQSDRLSHPRCAVVQIRKLNARCWPSSITAASVLLFNNRTRTEF